MDIERFVELLAVQKCIEYFINGKGLDEHNSIQIVYATIKDDTVVIAGEKEDYLEIGIDEITDIIYLPEEDLIKVIRENDEINIIYYSPGDKEVF